VTPPLDGSLRLAAGLDESAIRALPKAEVHVHLEGTFELADLLELSKAAGTPLPGAPGSLFALGGGLGDFLRFLDWECGLIRTAEQAARLAYRFAARETSSGVRYADVIVNPSHWNGWRDRLPALFDALAGGLAEAEQDGLATVGLCVSPLRQQSAQESVELVGWILGERPERVVALSIDGNERAAGRTGGRFAEAFTRARDGGLHRTVHAGESSVPGYCSTCVARGRGPVAGPKEATRLATVSSRRSSSVAMTARQRARSSSAMSPSRSWARPS
jgi:adenosine deaminase